MKTFYWGAIAIIVLAVNFALMAAWPRQVVLTDLFLVGQLFAWYALPWKPRMAQWRFVVSGLLLIGWISLL